MHFDNLAGRCAIYVHVARRTSAEAKIAGGVAVKKSAGARCGAIEIASGGRDIGTAERLAKLDSAGAGKLVAQNVAKGVKVIRPSRDRADVVIPMKAELRAMLDHPEPDFRPMLLTAIVTGFRSSELRGLRWQDVDLKADTITVAQRADQWGVIGSPKSKAGRRTIPIAPQVASELRKWKLRCPTGKLGLAFPNGEGGVHHHSNLLRRQYWPLRVKAGVAGVILDAKGKPKVDEEGQSVLEARYGLHALRHAAASNWIKQGIDLKRLTVWMGHSSVQVTLDTYGHLIADPARDSEIATRSLEGLIA